MAFTPIAWACRLSLIAGTALAASGGLAAVVTNPLTAAVLGLAYAWRRLRRHRGSLTSQGTARFADHAVLARAGMLGESGLIVGRARMLDRPTPLAAARSLLSPRTSSSDATRAFFAAFFGGRGHAGRFIRVPDYVHLATFAPTGRGKGQSVLKPNLLTHSGSVVVVDPDAELFRDVGEFRERAFGHRSIVLAPFGVPGRPDILCDTLNPLSFIDPASPYFLDDCLKLASLIVVRTGDEGDGRHFLEATEIVLTALIAFTVACEPNPEERTFQVIRGIATSPDRFARTIDYMIAHGGVIARLGNQLKWFRDRELGSVMTTLQRMTTFLDSPIVAACSGRSTFDPEILRDQTSLWLVLPSDRMQNLAQLMRLWVGTILTRLTRDAADESKTVLFLIDEAANIGHIPQLEDAVTLMRKRGIRLWFFFQSLGQLSKCYGERAGVFLDNIDTQQYFGLNAFESADTISKRLGQETILVRSRNFNEGGARQYGNTGPTGRSSNFGSGTTYTEQGRALMRPEEVLLSDGAIVFHRNRPPILAALPLAHSDPDFLRCRTRRLRPAGVPAFFLSGCWLVLGAIIFNLGTGHPRRPPLALPSLDVAGWRSRLHSWILDLCGEAPPESPEAIRAWLKQAERYAERRKALKYREAYAYLNHRLSVPPFLHKRVTDSEYVATINRARAAADQAERRFEAWQRLHPPRPAGLSLPPAGRAGGRSLSDD